MDSSQSLSQAVSVQIHHQILIFLLDWKQMRQTVRTSLSCAEFYIYIYSTVDQLTMKRNIIASITKESAYQIIKRYSRNIGATIVISLISRL